ncbi:DUF6283 family protein [Streptomyces chartreusis]|uniref:DUF6283 family protein n=1 Tax=Streptomyces chartreusis TaxID=1969 RepID=UPI0036A0F5E9
MRGSNTVVGRGGCCVGGISVGVGNPTTAPRPFPWGASRFAPLLPGEGAEVIPGHTQPAATHAPPPLPTGARGGAVQLPPSPCTPGLGTPTRVRVQSAGCGVSSGSGVLVCGWRLATARGIESAPRYDPANADSDPAATALTHPTSRWRCSRFQCHQHDADSGMARVCGGWAACHGPGLLAPRAALVQVRIDPTTFQAITEYTLPVPLFATGTQAAEHGRRDIDLPGEEAAGAMDKITRNRNSITSR